MLKPEILKAEPAQDYENLKRQFFALKRLCESKMHQCQFYSQKLADYDREAVISRNEALNSEREMNAILTQENEALSAENEALKGQLSSHQKLSAKGIYYTNEEIIKARRNFVLHDLTNPTKEVEGWLNKIRAQAVRDAIDYASNIDWEGDVTKEALLDYADKLERGEV